MYHSLLVSLKNDNLCLRQYAVIIPYLAGQEEVVNEKRAFVTERKEAFSKAAAGAVSVCEEKKIALIPTHMWSSSSREEIVQHTHT